MTRTLTTPSSSLPATDQPRRRFSPLVIAAALVVVVVGLALAAMSLSGGKPSEADAQTAADAAPGADAAEWFQVERKSFDLTVIASGELESSQQIEVKSQVEGTTTIVQVIDEGVAVKKGDQLVKLADDQIRENLEQETLTVEKARSDKIAADQDLEIKRGAAESDRKAAELKLELANLALAKWREGDLVQKRQELSLALEKAKRTLERAEREYQDSKQLYQDKFISRSELDDDELAVIEAKAGLKTAELDLEVYEKYTYPKEQKQFASDVDQANAELQRTIQKSVSELAQALADVESKTRQLTIREDRLKQMQEQLAATTILAPEDGMVVYASSVGGMYRGRTELIDEGRRVGFNETIILLPDTRKMVAALRVHEAMIPQVKPGQKVTIDIDAHRGAPLEGTVSQVAVMAEDGGWWNPQLREYKVRVELPPQAEGTLKPAMRCLGQIQIGRVDDAIAVPVQAVHTEGDRRFCYVPAGNRVKAALVTIDRSSETFVEIKTGLEPGGRVLLRQPRPGEALQEKAPVAAKAPPA